MKIVVCIMYALAFMNGLSEKNRKRAVGLFTAASVVMILYILSENGVVFRVD